MCTALLVVMNRGFTVMNQKINDSRLFGCSKVKKSQQVIRPRSVSKKMVATFVSKAGHIAKIPPNEQRTVTVD
ncbi:unnamed protein product [Acanthoscelides obtectus]|uniref:Uncharacterized protein n=1 Tax=Acanthoscelides obtectus TaxID=200917 RepID=A0A9P0JRI5_ACAOB|nr:unnamed protein product [Acanthoscelides obtectus]CAK1665841.1 hypothetical protein AOBTE_LOCUS24999 [Acanthoscelides obtectus]